jgi:hypothetical protein
MAQQLTITFQEYESLVFLAREGARLKGFLDASATDPRLAYLVDAANRYVGTDANKARELETFLKSIERQNGITRYYLAVRWQELDEPLPPRTAGAATRWPENWPPYLEGSVEMLSRPIAKGDVTAFLSSRAKNPTNVMVTIDPGMRVGWTPLDQYFV